MTNFPSSVGYYCQREGSEQESADSLLVNSVQNGKLKVSVANPRRGFRLNRLLLMVPTTSTMIILKGLLGNLFIILKIIK